MKKISLPMAVLININIILGAGIFINPRPLTKFLGVWGFCSYILASLIVFPIVYSISNLASVWPTAGGMYIYPKKYLNSFLGFVSGWGYFLGKTASPALLIHTFVTFFYNQIYFFKIAPILFWDSLFIFFLISLNIFGVYIGGKIQYFFIILKAIPILVVIILYLFFFNTNFFSNFNSINIQNLFHCLPSAIFVLLSFEMICSIGHMIENPNKNLHATIFLSFFSVATIATLFQFLIFGLVGTNLSNLSDPIDWTAKIIHNPILNIILNFLIFGSIIAGAFGSLTTNCWNLYKLAQDKHFPLSKYLTIKNKYNVPWTSLIIEGILACLLLAISIDLIPLQNMTVLGIGFAYLLNAFSAIKIEKKNYKIFSYIAIVSSLYIILLCFNNLMIYGISIAFSTIFIFGIIFKIIKNLNLKLHK
ncbi:amino acid permease [Candidatus Dependentiae bacterium]|nr:amino acid permease [Candidatus Dependentiae bacterium]